MPNTSKEKKVVCYNKKASHEYFIEEVYEAGLALLGPEVKSLREGRANLTDSYARMKHGEFYLYNMDISPYPFAHHADLEPKRVRKLLLTGREIKRLTGKTEERGFTLIPLKVYFSGGWAKVEIALAKGKRSWDKRQAIKEKEMKRELDRVRKGSGRPRGRGKD
jgi:SsrA-binding protein